MPRFQGCQVEARYQEHRQAFLAKQDVYVGTFLVCCGLVWLARLAFARPCQIGLMLRIVSVGACCALPLALTRIKGPHFYARHRLAVVLLVRLAFLVSPTGMGSRLADCPAPWQGAWQAAGHLLLISRTFSLLVMPLGFLLNAASTTAHQVVAVALAMRRVRDVCAHYLPDPDHPSHDSLARLATWLGQCPLVFPVPLPSVGPSANRNPCTLLAHWVQITWLCVLPCLMVHRWEVMARNEFVRSLPPGAVSREEHAQWAALCLSPLWKVMAVLMPPLSLAVWQALLLRPGGTAAGSWQLAAS